MYGVMLGRVTSSCILAIFTLLRVVYICFCVVESVVLPVVPSSPVHYASMDIKCTVGRLGSRTRCYAVLAMPSYGGNRGGCVADDPCRARMPMFTRPGNGNPSNLRLRSMTGD